MASLTVEAVTTTVRALYRDTVQTATGLNSSDIILAFALGLGGSLVAAWLPARDAASTPPAQFLRMGKRIPPFPIFQHPWIGVTAILAGAALLLAPPWNRGPGVNVPAAGYLTAFLWLVGGTLVTAHALKWAGALVHRLSGDSAPGRLAGSRLLAPTSRHQLALSGFFVAIGMAASMAFLINSFEHTVTRWLEQRLRADLFVSSIGFQGADSGQRMPGQLLDEIGRTGGVEAVDRFRSIPGTVNGVPVNIGGTRFDLLGGKQELLWIMDPFSDLERPGQADATGFANENLINRTGVSRGDIVEITTPDGVKRIWLGGVHADYSSDNGLLLIDLPLIEEWYRISEYDTASVFLKPGTDPAVVQAGLRERFPGLAIRQNGELMETALGIFNQTFAVTRALQLIGLVVALSGLVLSLLSLLRESGRELSLQKTLGMSRREIAMTTAIEGVGIALTGLVAGIVLSVALGMVLVYVINRQSFGWTLQVNYPASDIALLAGSVIILGFTVSYTTGWLYLRKWKQEVL
jgi:putative ABC transport system permease protein